MPYRPYPNRERALGNLRRQQMSYLYGHVPRRYVAGIDPSGPDSGAVALRPSWPAGPGTAVFTEAADAAMRRAFAPLAAAKRHVEAVGAACHTEATRRRRP